MKMPKHKSAGLKAGSTDGFSLVEVLIAMVILMIGLLAYLALFGTAISATQHAQEDLVAKQKARETLEAIYSARDDSAITFAQIANDTAVPPGVFKTGFNPLFRVANNSGAILGTATEGPQLDYVLAPNAAGNLTVQVPLTDYTRQIQITPMLDAGGNINPNLKKVTVTVRVTSSKYPRDYSVYGYISSYH